MDSDELDFSSTKLTDLLIACDEALAKGDQRSSLDAIRSTSGVEQKQIRKKLACLQMLRNLWVKPGSVGTKVPTKIGRFEIRQELGRGGYGVVYQAFDPKLGRDIALKLPREDLLLTPALRQRFQIEAHAAAGLDHVNIVPIYEAGEAGTVCYIASAYCPGPALDEWLRQQKEPVPIRWAAEMTACLADAVQHAHDRGVLHRDLKPANVLLYQERIASDFSKPVSATESKARLSTSKFVPKITDFGLAKLDPAVSPQVDRSPTYSGAIVGTPAYMSPEQAAGKVDSIGPTADVYALGAILYECLTGRAPFLADTVLDTLQLVRSVEPVPPTRLRAKLPRDLETICLKCLQKDPRQRYATAADLTDDLRRYLDQKPIQARPVSQGERIWRWCRRNPRLAGMATALVFVLLAGISGIIWQWRRADDEAWRASQERDDARAAKAVALTEKDRAEANTRRARDAVTKMTMAGRELYMMKGQDQATQSFMEQVITFHEQFLTDKSDDPRIVLEASEAWCWMAGMRHELGQRPETIKASQRGLELIERLLADHPDDPRYQSAWAYQTRTMGSFLRWHQQPWEAMVCYEKALQVFKQLHASRPDDANYRNQLANTLMNLAGMHEKERQWSKAESMFNEALTLQQANLASEPENRYFRRELALSNDELGMLLWKSSNKPRGEQLCRTALKMWLKLVQDYPTHYEFRGFLADCQSNLGDILSARTSPNEAIRSFRDALANLDKLRKDFPRNPQYSVDLLLVWSKLGQVHLGVHDLDEAKKSFQQAVAAADHLTKVFPTEAVGRQKEITTARMQLAEFMDAKREK